MIFCDECTKRYLESKNVSEKNISNGVPVQITFDGASSTDGGNILNPDLGKRQLFVGRIAIKGSNALNLNLFGETHLSYTADSAQMDVIFNNVIPPCANFIFIGKKYTLDI